MNDVKNITLVFISAALLSCSDEPENQQSNNQPEPIATVDTAAPKQRIPIAFTPDPNFKLPAEIYTTTGPTNITRDILQSQKDGTIWISSWQGLYSYNYGPGSDGKFTNWTVKENLAHNRGFCIYEDSKGNIWFGTFGAGVYRYDGTTFRNFSMSDGLNGNVVSCIYEDKKGDIWIGTDSGVCRYDHQKFYNFDTWETYGAGIGCISQDNDSVMWFGNGRGVIRYINNRLIEFRSPQGGAFGCNALVRDRNGAMWIGGVYGLYKYGLDEQNNPELTEVLPEFISYLNLDRSGNVLISCGDGGTGAGEIYFSNGKTTEKLYSRSAYGGAGDQVFRAIQDGTGKIWFGCVQGVCRLDGESAFCFGSHE